MQRYTTWPFGRGLMRRRRPHANTGLEL